MNQSYTQQILNCFAEMDIDKLRFYLKDEYSYQDTTKDIFLEELGKLFTDAKNSGNLELLIYKGQCSSDTCPNCGKGGYRFVGNESKDYFDLIFEGTDEISDIYDCSNFCTNDDTGELSSKGAININEDETIDFIKTPEYLIRLSAAQAALEEMTADVKRIITFDTAKYWLQKHTELYYRLGGYDVFVGPRKWTQFLYLFYELDQLNEYISKYYDPLLKANKTFSIIDSEQDSLDWLMRYEQMKEKTPFEAKYGVEQILGYFKMKWPPTIFIGGETYKMLFDFIENYTQIYSEMFNKYCIYTTEEYNELYIGDNSQEQTENIDLISYHLQRRKEAEEIGVTYPLNVYGDILES